MTAQIILVNLLVVVGFMSVVWAVARSRKRIDTVDTVWGLSFIIVALSTLAQQPSWRSVLILLLVSLWGGRLSLHLARRSGGRDEDPRYKELSDKWSGNFWLRAYLSIFLTQGLLVWIISAPIVFAAGTSAIAPVPLAIIGTVIWLIGYMFEVVGDRQLRDFIADAGNKGKVMDKGLWQYSRHPNYFGEITQWVAIAIIASSTGWGWLGYIGPAVLAYVIICISGIAMTERKHAKDPAWQDYIRRTSMLIPLPPRS